MKFVLLVKQFISDWKMIYAKSENWRSIAEIESFANLAIAYSNIIFDYACIEALCAGRAVACSESPSMHRYVFPSCDSLVHDLVQMMSMSSLVPSGSLNIWMSVSSPPFFSN